MRAHGALEQLRLLMRPTDKGTPNVRRLPYQWAIEGDIKGCFDNISHHGLMQRVRRRIGDAKVNRLVVAFLKAGVLAEEQFLRSDSGTPQGGILSPLLANVALSVIEERYERHVWPRRTPTLRTEDKRILLRANKARGTDRKRGLPIFYPVRYADDFIILVSVPPGPEQSERAEQAAHQEKAALAAYLKDELHLELSESKTLVTPVTRPMRFLGHHVRVRPHPRHRQLVVATLIPRARIAAARTHQATVRPTVAELELGREPAHAQCGAARILQLLPPCVGSQARIHRAGPLPVVDHLSMGQEEAWPRVAQDCGFTLRLAQARGTAASVEGWRHPAAADVAHASETVQSG